MKEIAILGSTGSIGTSTLNVIRRFPDRFRAVGLAAGYNLELLSRQVEEFSPRWAYLRRREDAAVLQERFPGLEVLWGEEGMEAFSCRTDYQLGVSALVGVAGLRPTWNMIRAGKTVALANKEVLVAGGRVVMDAVRTSGAQLVTVDSEHSAIMQCLRGEEHGSIEKLLLTASGGPFLDRAITDDITPAQALAHPTWKMGAKISIDSATMMNKGFEIIEARWLFDVPPEQIQVVIHRQSLVHSMVQFVDGTIMASIGPANMELPIAYALDYPNRLPSAQRLDLFQIGQLRFEAPDLDKFPCLRLAAESARAGHGAQVVLNAANEVLVAAFLAEKLPFTAIPRLVGQALEKCPLREPSTVEEILDLDREARERTRALARI